jgi:hypothetical protein
MGVIEFLVVVVAVVLGLAFLAIGVAMLPIIIPLAAIYLIFAAPEWGIPLAAFGLFLLLIKRKV